MVTFGIKPTRSESGYGYLELSKDTLDRHGSSNLQRFVEKPSVDIAAQMLAAAIFYGIRNLSFPCSRHDRRLYCPQTKNFRFGIEVIRKRVYRFRVSPSFCRPLVA